MLLLLIYLASRRATEQEKLIQSRVPMLVFGLWIRLVLETHPAMNASIWIRVPQAVRLPPASFRPRLTAGPWCITHPTIKNASEIISEA